MQIDSKKGEKNIYREEEWLRKQYIETGKTLQEIADKCKVSYTTIHKWKEKFNIGTQFKRNRIKIQTNKSTNKKSKTINLNKEWLKKEYIEKEKSVSEIASRQNVVLTTVYRWLKKYNIATKKEHASGYSINPEKTNYRNKEWLSKQLVTKNRKQIEIAKECGVSRDTISGWAKQFNIKHKAQTIKDKKKKCSICGKWLPLKHFSKDTNSTTGLSSECSKCQYKREKQKREENPTRKINDSVSKGISQAISDKGGTHWEKLLPYSIEDLINHLENQFQDGMSWENYGKRGWHIDHIIPRSYFNFDSFRDEGFLKCWGLNNLQPLWAKDNISKSDKIPQEVLKRDGSN